MEGQLLALTIGHAISVIFLVLFALFILSRNPKDLKNQLFAAFTISAAFFSSYFSVAINLEPSKLAHSVWLLNIFNVFIVAFYAHLILVLVNRAKDFTWYIRGTYIWATLLVLSTAVFPTSFVPVVTSKLYTLSYLNAGPIYHLMLVTFLGFAILPFIELLRAHRRGGLMRIHSEYYIVASIIGYAIGSISFFLVYDIPVDPLLGMFLGVFTIPIAYGILNDQLLDIRLVLKRALIYAVGIGVLVGILTSLIFLNNFLLEQFPFIQVWMVPTIVGVLGFVAGRVVWIQLRESDRLKYEFLTVATHKLRTPLTRIRWATAALTDDKSLPETAKENIDYIDSANQHLIELTDILINAANTENDAYAYRHEEVDLVELGKRAVERFSDVAKSKKVSVSLSFELDTLLVIGDKERLNSVVEVFIENAIMYTPKDGSVLISIKEKGGRGVFSVTDSGIGVSKEEQARIFSRFYRTDEAKKMDTEGVGLGLSVSKEILEKHHGKIGVTSEGEGKGSTFWFSVPTAPK